MERSRESERLQWAGGAGVGVGERVSIVAAVKAGAERLAVGRYRIAQSYVCKACSHGKRNSFGPKEGEGEGEGTARRSAQWW